jgi:PilZ domain-containing protein
MQSFPVPQCRRSKRVVLKRRASLVINVDRKAKRLPCLVLDSSKEGFRLRGSFDLRRGQVVELIVDEETPTAERCNVVWVGKAGSKQEGEVGLETVR